MEEASYGFDIWQYFNGSCFDSYDETVEKNYYAVFGEVFRKIAQEEASSYKYNNEGVSDAPEFLDFPGTNCSGWRREESLMDECLQSSVTASRT